MSKAVNTGNGYPSGMKNRIINGSMDISQRGTSFAAASGYTLDRWTASAASSDGAITVTQNSDVPSSNEFQNSLRATVTTADASIAAGHGSDLGQNIEGYNIRDLIGRTFTISFWVRSSKIGIHCTGLRNAGTDRTYISEYTVNVANTWEYKTITIAGGLTFAGTWNYINGIGLYLRWTLATGTTYQTTGNSWVTGNFLGTSNQVNCLDTIGNIFAITGVQLELGPVATPFEHRLYSAELALCQRYYQRLDSLSDVSTYFGTGSFTNATGIDVPILFAVQMRANPTLPDISVASTFQVLPAGVGGTLSSISLATPTKYSCRLACVSGTSSTAGFSTSLRANNTTSAYLGFSAEL